VSWETLTWRPVDASNPEGIAPILSEVDTLRSALEEAAASLVMAPVTITALEVADIASPSELPDGFAVVVTFELLGKGRLPLAVALDPSGGDLLAGSRFDVAELGRRLAEELDAAVGFIAGEGLQVGPADGATLAAGDALVLLRMTLTDADGAEARLVAAVDSEAPADLGMHLILVKEMGKITMAPPELPRAKPAAVEPQPAPQPMVPAMDPVALAAQMAYAQMQGGYPGMPGGYPQMQGMPGGYPGPQGMPQMPGGYPQMQGMPQQGGYPQMQGMPQQGGYPQMQGMPQQGGYPGYPGAGYASAPSAYPSNVRPLSFEELSGGSVTGQGGSMELLYGVNLEVTVEIGRTRLPIREVLALTPGSIVELDKLAGEKVDVLVNGHLIATGEVVVVDENFGVRITDVSARARRLAMGEGAA
jgi:flagellar motor switch protein FliN